MSRTATLRRLSGERAEAHLLEMAGDSPMAAQFYRLAAHNTVNLPGRNYLLMQAARLSRTL